MLVLFSSKSKTAPLDNEAILNFECWLAFPGTALRNVRGLSARWRLEEENEIENRKQIEAGSNSPSYHFSPSREEHCQQLTCHTVLVVLQNCQATMLFSKPYGFLKPLKENMLESLNRERGCGGAGVSDQAFLTRASCCFTGQFSTCL